MFSFYTFFFFKLQQTICPIRFWIWVCNCATVQHNAQLYADHFDKRRNTHKHTCRHRTYI